MIPAPSILRLACLFLGGTAAVQSAVLNDGTTTNRLVALTAASSSASVRLLPDPGGFLRSAQQGASLTYALRTIWYAGNARLTNGTYTATAEFRPASIDTKCRGGLAAWLDAGSSNALVLQVVPASFGAVPPSFQLFAVRLADTLQPESLQGLYNLDGSPATGSLDSAWCELGPDYRPADFAQFELRFEPPSAADLEVLADATARLRARVLQVDPSGTVTNAVSARTLDLLTNLPVPDPANHRVGYYGVWASLISPGADIGHHRSLSAEGAVVVNRAPAISITSPAPGAVFTAPAAVNIVAEASDPDDGLREVAFYEGANRIGIRTEPPFEFSWGPTVPGRYTLTAVATDRSGESTVADPVAITVTEPSGEAPELEIRWEGDQLVISWKEAGYQLQYKTALAEATWVDVPDTLGVTRVTLSASTAAQYFRLVGTGAPTGPKLEIQWSDGVLLLSWPDTATGYRLQTQPTLNDPVWIDLETTGNSHMDPATGLTGFYRLIQP